MKKILLSAMAVMAFFLISCNDSYELGNSVAVKQENKVSNEYMIKVEDAVAVASNALDMFNGQAKNSRNAGASKSVKQVTTYPVLQSRSSDASLYIVNFEEGGFAIVPADSRATDVYALSNEGEFNLENENSVYFMELAEEYLQEELNKASWAEPAASITPVEPVMPPGGGPGMYVIVEIDGQKYYWNSIETQTIPFYLLATRWHQGDPYRHFCFTDEGENAMAGCVPIAMAQIMAYHKKPESFNNHFYQWDFLDQTPTISETSWLVDNVGYLVHDIGEHVNVQYGTEESGAFDFNAVETFRAFGYSASLVGDYDVIEIISSLDDSNPVYISGRTAQINSHTWVLDGYYTKKKIDEYYDFETLEKVGERTTYTHYLHCNWGYEMSENCYCLSEIFTLGTLTYDRDFDLIYAQ